MIIIINDHLYRSITEINCNKHSKPTIEKLEYNSFALPTIL